MPLQSPETTNRFNNQLPAQRQQCKIMGFGGIAYNCEPLWVVLDSTVDRITILNVLRDTILPYMQKHHLSYLYWDNAQVHGTKGV